MFSPTPSLFICSVLFSVWGLYWILTDMNWVPVDLPLWKAKQQRSLFTSLWTPGCLIGFKDCLDGKTEHTGLQIDESLSFCVTVSKTEPSSTSSHWVFTVNLGSRFWYFYHIVDENTEVQRGQETSLGSHSSEAVGAELWVQACDACPRTSRFNSTWHSASVLKVWSEGVPWTWGAEKVGPFLLTLMIDFVPGTRMFPCARGAEPRLLWSVIISQ